MNVGLRNPTGGTNGGPNRLRPGGFCSVPMGLGVGFCRGTWGGALASRALGWLVAGPLALKAATSVISPRWGLGWFLTRNLGRRSCLACPRLACCRAFGPPDRDVRCSARWGLGPSFFEEPGAALVPRLPQAGLSSGLWPSLLSIPKKLHILRRWATVTDGRSKRGEDWRTAGSAALS